MEEIEMREVYQAAMESNPNDYSTGELMQPTTLVNNLGNESRVSQIGLLQN